MKDQFVTVVYRIENAHVWSESNPLKYAHNGLSACTVSIGDVIVDRDALVEALELIREEGNLISSDIATKAINSLRRQE